MNLGPQLEAVLSPQVCLAGEPSTLHALITVDAGESPAVPIDLCIARVDPAAPAHSAALEAALAGTPVTTLTPEGPRASLRLSGPGFRTVLDALKAMLERPTHADRTSHLLLIVGGLGLEPPEPVIETAATLAERGAGVDLIVCHPAAELGLLSQITALGRGELLHQHPLDEAQLTDRVRALQSQPLVGALLDVSVAPGVEAGRIFRAAPSPLLLGIPRLSATDRRIILDACPLGRGARAQWLFDLQVPPRPAGCYRLLDCTLRYKDLAGSAVRHCELTIEFADAPWAVRIVHGPTVNLRNRVDLIGEWEQIAGAYHRGDGRRVAVGLSTLVRRLLALGEREVVEQTFSLRLAFLRSGYLDQVAFNQLRRDLDGMTV